MTARCTTASAWTAMQRTAKTMRSSRDLWDGPWAPERVRAWRSAPAPPSRSSSRAGATARGATRHCLAVPEGVSMRTSPRAIRVRAALSVIVVPRARRTRWRSAARCR
eukprot:15431314-Alexandrium_andersonii.AAC.1